MGRSPCCEKAHTNKGAWTKEEDQLLIDYIRTNGEGSWRSLPKSAGNSFPKKISLCFQKRFLELLSWIRRTSPTAPSTLRKLITQAVVYATWKQRNNMLHNSNHIAPAAAFMIIDREVINSINARRHRRKFRNLMSLWLI